MIKDSIIEKMRLEIPFYVKNGLPDIYSWKEFENLINLRPFVNDIRFIIAGKKPQDYFTWPEQSWMTDINSYPPKLLNEIIEEYVCYLRDCSRVNEKINQICGDIEKKCGWPTDAHIYFSSKIKQKGFDVHKDNQHNLILQVEGQSIFKVWSIDNDIILDVTMKSGDVIFIPKDLNHQVIPLTKRLSISFPCDTVDNVPEAQDRHWIKLI